MDIFVISLFNYKHSYSVSILKVIRPMSYTLNVMIKYYKELRSQSPHKLCKHSFILVRPDDGLSGWNMLVG
jgi:hypothetical protein